MERTGWMLERKPCGKKPAMWWTGGRPPLATDNVWTQDPNAAVVWADGASATATVSAMLRIMGFRTQADRARYLERVGVTEHVWMTPNDVIQRASPASGEAPLE